MYTWVERTQVAGTEQDSRKKQRCKLALGCRKLDPFAAFWSLCDREECCPLVQVVDSQCPGSVWPFLQLRTECLIYRANYVMLCYVDDETRLSRGWLASKLWAL